MTRSRLFVASSLGLVALVAVAAVAALLLRPQTSLGPVPSAALALPGDSPFVMGLDVRRLVASSFYKNQSARQPVDVLQEIAKQTGLDAERDIDTIVFAGSKDGAQRGVAVVVGRFDTAKLQDRIGPSLAVLGDGAFVAGEPTLVRATVDNHSAGKTGLASNAAQVARLERVKPGSAFWIVGDENLLRRLPQTLPSPLGEGGGSLSLPELQQLVVSGEFEPQLAIDVVGDTADASGAKNLAEMLGGLIALVKMQTAQKPELAGLATAFNVSHAQNQVSVAVRMPPDLVEALQKSARGGAATPEVR